MGPIDHLRFCPERGRLLDLVKTATKNYSSAADDLARNMGTMPEADYQRVRAAVEHARLDAEHACEALLQHRREHGC